MYDAPPSWWKGNFVLASLAFMALVLTLAACGGGDSSSDSSDDAAEEPSSGTAEPAEPDGAESGDSDGSESATPTEGMDVPDGLPLAEGLIPELALLPLPGGAAVFQAGSAYTAEQDFRETAVQMVHFTLTPEELTEFYLAELPAAGYVILADQGGITDPSEIEPGRQLIVIFTDPDGLPGHVTITPGAWSPSQMNINLFRSGVS